MHKTERLTIVDGESGDLLLSLKFCTLDRAARENGQIHRDVFLHGATIRIEPEICTDEVCEIRARQA